MDDPTLTEGIGECYVDSCVESLEAGNFQWKVHS